MKRREDSQASRSAASIIGTGRMGIAFARALMAAGHEVTVWNRTAAGADLIVGEGAHRATSVVEAVEASPIALISVLDYDASEAILRSDEVAAALQGKTLVQFTTGTPSQARAAAEWAERHNIAYVEAYPHVFHNQVATEEAGFVYSGPRSRFDAVEELLSIFGKAVFLGEEYGLAKAVCIATVPLFHGSILGLLQSVAFAEREGLPMEHVREILTHFAGGTVKTMVSGVTDRAISGEIEKPLASVAVNVNGSVRTLEACRESGVSLLFPAFVAAVFGRAKEDGLDRVDVSAMLDYFRTPSPEYDQRVQAGIEQHLVPAGLRTNGADAS